MRKNKFTILFSTILLLSIIIGIFLLPKSISSWRWNMAAEAVGSMPYQIGLTNVMITNCFITGEPPICTGSILCSTFHIDVARCLNHSDVNGKPAGGMGNEALFLNTAIAKAGLTPGGQLIAGGLSMVAMDQGVLASAGGCFGCVAKDSAKDRIFAWLDKYIIAGFKQSEK
jgi:hypothetical protein